MQPLNRVCFEILKEKDAENPTFDAVIYRVLDWLKQRSFVTDPGVVLDCDQTMPPLSAGEGVLVESLLLSEGDKRGWGVRYSHPDSKQPELRWVGEITLRDEGGNRIFYQNTIGVRHTGDSVAPYELRRSNPTLNREILRDFKCFTKHGHRLTAALLGLARNENSVKLFIGILNDAKRSHPVVYVSPAERENSLTDVPRLARVLAGMAHVVVAEAPELAREVSGSLPAGLVCSPGGIRIYWPDFHRNQEPQHHFGLEDWELMKAGSSFAYQLVDLIARQAVLRNPEEYASWGELQNWHNHQAIQSNQSPAEMQQMLEMFEEDNRKQQQALDTANKEIARLSGILATARLQAEKLNRLLGDSDDPGASVSLEMSDRVAIASDDDGEEAIEIEADSSEEAEQESVEDEAGNPDELGAVMTAAGFYARIDFEDRQSRLPIGTATGSVPELNEKKPLKYQGFSNGDWFEHSSGHGRVLELYSTGYYSPSSDRHKVWLYSESTGKSVIGLDYALGQPSIRRKLESDIPDEVIELFSQYEKTLTE